MPMCDRRLALTGLLVAALAPAAMAAQGGPPQQIGQGPAGNYVLQSGGNQTVNLGTGSLTAATVVQVQGPCDIFAAAGQTCVAAHSVTRRLLATYTGPLFQLTRASDGATANIGAPTSAYDAGAVQSFCAGTDCYFSTIYDQTGNGNNLTQPNVALMAPWMLHPLTGLPVVWTSGNSAFYQNLTSTSKIPTGAAAATTFYVRGTDIYSSCCGDYGRVETNPATPADGATDALAYGNTGGSLAWGADLGGTIPSVQAVNLSQIALLMDTFSPAAGVFTARLFNELNYVLRAGAYVPGETFMPSVSPPVVQAGISLGESGSGATAASEFFEGAVVSGTATDATNAQLAANVAQFYAHTAAVLEPADLLTNSGCAGAGCTAPNTGGGATSQRDISAVIGGAWGLRCLRASYTGNVATLRRASGGSALSVSCTDYGDFDDATAQAFCAGTTCFATRLNNQAIVRGGNGTDPSVYDMVQATASLQPQVIFGDLNGKAALRSNGTQFLCTATSIQSLSYPWTMIAVADRTGNTSALGFAISADGAQGALGYAAAPNTTTLVPGSAGVAVTASAADSAWHFLIGGSLAGVATPALGGPGVMGTSTSSSAASVATNVCLFSGAYYSDGSWVSQDVLTGDIAEAMIAAPGLSSDELSALYLNERAYYGGVF